MLTSDRDATARDMSGTVIEAASATVMTPKDMAAVDSSSQDTLEWLTVEDFAQQVRRSRRQISRYVRDGTINADVQRDSTGRPRYMILSSEVARFLERHPSDRQGQSARDNVEHTSARDGRRGQSSGDAEATVQDMSAAAVSLTAYQEIVDRLERMSAEKGALQLALRQQQLALQADNEQARRDREEAESSLRSRVNAERERAERAEREALEEQLRRQRVEADLAAVQQRMAELEAQVSQPWWRRLIGMGR